MVQRGPRAGRRDSTRKRSRLRPFRRTGSAEKPSFSGRRARGLGIPTCVAVAFEVEVEDGGVDDEAAA